MGQACYSEAYVHAARTRGKLVQSLSIVFVLTTSQEDPGAILEIKDEIRKECARLGEVTNVVLFDKEPNGVVSVRFTDAQAANACVEVWIFPYPNTLC